MNEHGSKITDANHKIIDEITKWWSNVEKNVWLIFFFKKIEHYSKKDWVNVGMHTGRWVGRARVSGAREMVRWTHRANGVGWLIDCSRWWTNEYIT
jgi:hypothetical protein